MINADFGGDNKGTERKPSHFGPLTSRSRVSNGWHFAIRYTVSKGLTIHFSLQFATRRLSVRNAKKRVYRLQRSMIRSFVLSLACGLSSLSLWADDTVPAARMFPSSTQALISLPQTSRFIDTWGKTQLGRLAADSQLEKFWKSQRDEMKARLTDAGWQLSFQVEDIESISEGQTSIGWIARDGDPKPYSVAAVIDIGSRDLQAKEFLQRVDGELKQRKATSKVLKINDVDVTYYQWPSPTNPSTMLQSYYAINKGQLIACDDERSIKEFLEAQSGTKANCLANEPVYQVCQSKLKPIEEPELEYFVNPLGMAKLLRSIGSKPKKGQTDLLKMLTDLGFGAIHCAAGNLQFAEESHDVIHQGFVKLDNPVADPVKILTFPNIETFDAPTWLSSESASIIAFSWDINEAFPRFKYLVDGYTNTPGMFDTTMKDIRSDPQGPRIDVYKEVLPFLTTQFFIVTEITKPITPNSKRSMVAVKLTDPDNKLMNAIEKYGKNEPNGSALDYEGYRIWFFQNDMDDEDLEADFASGTKKSPPKKEDEEAAGGSDEEPLLQQWAISVVDGYFVFGSDPELIKEAIDRSKKKEENSFLSQPDVQRVTAELGSIASDQLHCMRQVDLSDRSFEMQYELFREGKLNASRSVAAAIMDRLLDPKRKNQGKQQKLNGNALPPYQAIQSYFMPGGARITTSEDGWYVQSFILAPKP
jgi:hypothetical protein